MTSYATNVDCTTKITPSLCRMLNQATADSDTFSVSIIFFPPAKDTSAYCRNLDPKQNPRGSDSCELSGYNSTYYAKLKSDARTMFTKFELWDAKRPAVRLTPPDSGKRGYMGVVATKSTIIAVLKETYVSAIEDWQDYGPAHILSHTAPRNEGMGKQSESFLPNGRVVATRSLVKSPYFLK